MAESEVGNSERCQQQQLLADVQNPVINQTVPNARLKKKGSLGVKTKF
jgi:hypothetical protein